MCAIENDVAVLYLLLLGVLCRFSRRGGIGHHASSRRITQCGWLPRTISNGWFRQSWGGHNRLPPSYTTILRTRFLGVLVLRRFIENCHISLLIYHRATARVALTMFPFTRRLYRDAARYGRFSPSCRGP